MTVEEIVEKSCKNLPFVPTILQFQLINALSAFIIYHGPKDVFILNGYAGTGKTSVMGALIKSLKDLNIKTVLLAPTGRAAKVASVFSGQKAYTIHKRLFRGNSLDPSNHQLYLAPNNDVNTIFIVDESSLITDSQSINASILQLLIKHVYSSPGCIMILVGDSAQLPPVGMTQSPAMKSEILKNYYLNPIEFTLDQPLRQAAKSGILYNATFIRKALFNNLKISSFRIYKKRFPDIEIIGFDEIEDSLSSSWGDVGQEETLLITRSNKRANKYNEAIRRHLLYAEEPLERGEKIIISKNDYYWSKKNGLEDFLANGETVEILWMGKPEKKYGRWFVDVELRLQDKEEPIEAKIMLRSLMSDGPSIPKEEMQRFYNIVMAAYDGELSHKIKGALEDPYYNALQVKYAYCVTCHKAQGGQWKHVYIDLGGLLLDNITGDDFYRWLYTAVTRATEKVFFLNPDIKII